MMPNHIHVIDLADAGHTLSGNSALVEIVHEQPTNQILNRTRKEFWQNGIV